MLIKTFGGLNIEFLQNLGITMFHKLRKGLEGKDGR